MQYGLIGEHLTHSYSCDIHGAAAPYTYELKEIPPDELDAFLTERAFSAINVTIPYKQTVMPYLDGISDRARAIGAVNTVVNRGGKLYGDNTDFDGLSALAKKAGISFTGKKILILGTGGTSKTALAVATAAGAASVLRVSRTSGDGVITYAEAVTQHTDAQIIINTTPVGMYPHVEDAPPIDVGLFPRLEGVLDAVYNPLRTRLVQDALSRGIPAMGGLYMLAAQGVYASAIFQDVDVDLALIETVYQTVLRKKQNVVLIGMPSSGKTTVGKALAAITGKTFVDTDDLIVSEIGCSIADYFAAHGEAAFRKIECEIVSRVAQESGQIIATGGGAILNPDNVAALRRNGITVFLNRSPERLITTKSRPLSSDREALTAMYHKRLPLYRAAADLEIVADATHHVVAAAIQKELSL